MKIFTNLLNRTLLGTLGVMFCFALTSSPAQAQDVTAKTLVDRAQIQDLITHYYYNFGKEKRENFADFYAEDAELILGNRHFKGREGVAQAYGRGNGGADRPKPYSFNVTIGNPLIVVHGNTASAQLIYTEYLIDKQGDAPHIRAQGREYATFVKMKGKWLYKTREIKGGTEPPEGWKE